MQKLGFTLIEILCCLAIIALMLGIGLPVSTRLSANLKLNGSANLLASNLREIQAFAMQQGETASFDPNKILLPKTIRFAQSVPIAFSSSGYPIVGGSGTLILENQFKKTKKIIVSSMGRIRVEQ